MDKPATVTIAPKVTSKVTPAVAAPVVAAVAPAAKEEPQVSVPNVTQKVSLRTQAEQEAGKARLLSYRVAE